MVIASYIPDNQIQARGIQKSMAKSRLEIETDKFYEEDFIMNDSDTSASEEEESLDSDKDSQESEFEKKMKGMEKAMFRSS